MDKFYLIDKPIGITSFDVLRKLKKIINIKKMGHTGTLDPLASGLLLVGVGNYTKLIPFFEKDIKEYEFKINLNGNTPSFDIETEIDYISLDKQKYFLKNLKIGDIEDILNKNFTGKINQLPPKYSALKINGKKAFDLVREGIEFELKSREVSIYNIEIISYNYPEIHLKALVSAGTYIRAIARDLGELLQTGGYITFLRRTKIGNLDLSLSQTLDNFLSINFLKEENIFDKSKFLKLEENELFELNNGRVIKKIDFIGEDGIYFVKNERDITNIIEKEGLIIKPLRKI
ncbi:tRNA pseudouridine(55) synthase TruB [Candidatus Gracilibacteria bacterium]|nr:tRNA pseudouridine(55) synthase TruB [Candidatus Gracilibacteria bacterium]